MIASAAGSACGRWATLLTVWRFDFGELLRSPITLLARLRIVWNLDGCPFDTSTVEPRLSNFSSSSRRPFTPAAERLGCYAGVQMDHAERRAALEALLLEVGGEVELGGRLRRAGDRHRLVSLGDAEDGRHGERPRPP